MRWTLDQKKHHVAAWRASGLTREQYCKLYDIPFKSLRQWPQAEKRASASEIIPVSVSGSPGMANGRPLSDETVTLLLLGSIRMCCQPSQLTEFSGHFAMLTPDNVFLVVKPVNMRRGIDTLTQYVQNELNAAWHDGDYLRQFAHFRLKCHAVLFLLSCPLIAAQC